MKPLILASQSIGRSDLLEEAGYSFEVIVSYFDEDSIQESNPEELVRKLSIAKAHVAARQTAKPSVILAGDQVVVIGDKIIGKPKTPEELRSWLLELQNSYTDVIQGYAIIDTATGKELIGVDTARVHFKTIPREEMEQWLKMETPYKRAGGFSMRTPPSSNWIEGVEGERATVIGMPMRIVKPILDELLKEVA